MQETIAMGMLTPYRMLDLSDEIGLMYARAALNFGINFVLTSVKIRILYEKK